ncbi:hypothetical protein Dimus_038835 [Dionaea muscipula]
MVTFPRLFSIALDQNASIADYFPLSTGSSNWRVTFRIPLRAWQEELFDALQDQLHSTVQTLQDRHDRIVWAADPSGVFSVRSLYWHLEGSLGAEDSCLAVIWASLAAPRARFFCWLVWQYKVKTCSFLHRLGALGQNQNLLCVFCSESDEDVDHLFLHCRYVWVLWTRCFSWWGFDGVIPGSVGALLAWWSGMPVRRQFKKLWLAIPSVVIWYTWRSRNRLRFEKITPDWDRIAENILFILASAFSSSALGRNFTINDIIHNLKELLHGGR